MLKYDSNKNMFEAMPKSHTILIDINAQGIMDIDPVHMKFKNFFPETMELLSPMFMSGKLTPGEIIETEEKGYNILLLVTRYARVGPIKDSSEMVIENTLKILNKIERRMGSKPLISSIINRDIGTAWPRLQNVVRERKNINWLLRVK